MVRNNKETGITQTLAAFASNVNYEDLSPDVVDWAKYLCLDFAGVTLNGSTTDSAKTVVKALEDVGRSGPSAVIGTDKRVLPEYAALANGTAFHSIEMDDINSEMAECDVVLVVGANDTVNPAAAEDPGSPIAGMPVLEVWKAHQVVILKRGMATGYSGVENPLFFKDNARMLFGDAKESIDKLVGGLRG